MSARSKTVWHRGTWRPWGHRFRTYNPFSAYCTAARLRASKATCTQRETALFFLTRELDGCSTRARVAVQVILLSSLPTARGADALPRTWLDLAARALGGAHAAKSKPGCATS